MNTILMDNPNHVDKLGRVEFSRHLLDLITRVDAQYNGAVIGLEGVWGSGKTRVLHSLDKLVLEYVGQEKPILIPFNPWMVSGTSGLVEAMLLQMAAELSGGFKKNDPLLPKAALLASNIIEYASILGTVKNFAPAANFLLPGSGIVVSTIGNIAESTSKMFAGAKDPLRRIGKNPQKLSLMESRKRIEKILKEINRRVVILVDDLDRLPPAELASMVQAVKAVADFPNVVYVLAYDPDLAAEGIAKALDLKNGRAFLEKVIQVQLPLPDVPRRKFNSFLIDRLKTCINQEDLADNIKCDIEKSWGYVAAILDTPRDVERLRTRMSVAVPMILNQVNIADVILLEAISMKYPELIEWIQNHNNEIMLGGILQHDPDLVGRGLIGEMADVVETKTVLSGEKAGHVNEWESSIPDPRIKIPLRNAMAFLFEKCKRKWSDDIKRSQYRRVQQYRYWYRWRCYHDHHEKWSTSEIDQFLQFPQNVLASGLHLNPDDFIEFCHQVCDIGTDSLHIADSISLIPVYKTAEETLGIEFITQWVGRFGPIDALIIALRMDEIDNRLLAIEELIKQTSVFLSGRLLLAAFKDIRKNTESLPVERWLAGSLAKLKPLIELWFVKADLQLVDQPWTVSIGHMSPYDLLYWMGLFGRNEVEIQRIGEEFLGDDPNKLSMLFAEFTNQKLDDPILRNIDWSLLPNKEKLLELIDRAPDFSSTHSKIVAELRSQNVAVASGSPGTF